MWLTKLIKYKVWVLRIENCYIEKKLRSNAELFLKKLVYLFIITLLTEYLSRVARWIDAQHLNLAIIAISYMKRSFRS